MVVCHYLNKAVGQLRDVDSSVTDLVTKAVGIVEEVNNQELREIAWQLHPSPVRIGLEPSLASLVRGFEDSSSTTIKFRVPRTRKRVKPRAELPEDLRLAIFRLVEEALNNVRKHASASKVVLSLEFPRADSVRVTVQDDGQGYDMQTAKPGFGTLCMLDYCDALEGVARSRKQGPSGDHRHRDLPYQGRAGGRFGEGRLETGAPQDRLTTTLASHSRRRSFRESASSAPWPRAYRRPGESARPTPRPRRTRAVR